MLRSRNFQSRFLRTCEEFTLGWQSYRPPKKSNKNTCPREQHVLDSCPREQHVLDCVITASETIKAFLNYWALHHDSSSFHTDQISEMTTSIYMPYTFVAIVIQIYHCVKFTKFGKVTVLRKRVTKIHLLSTWKTCVRLCNYRFWNN